MFYFFFIIPLNILYVQPAILYSTSCHPLPSEFCFYYKPLNTKYTDSIRGNKGHKPTEIIRMKLKKNC